MPRREGLRETSWIGWIVERRGRSNLALSLLPVLYAGAVYTVAWAIAELGGFGGALTSTKQGWILSAETAWVLFWGAWSTQALRRLPAEIRAALADPDDRFERYCVSWQNRVFNPWVCVPAGLGLDVLLGFWFVHGHSWQRYFGSAWGGSHHAVKASVALILFLPVGPLIGTMLWGFAFYLWLVLQSRRWKLTPQPDLVVTELRTVTSFGLWTGLAWSMAVTLAILFFEPHLRLWPDILLLGLGAMGLALIVTPQLLVHQRLVSIRDTLLRETAALLPGDDPRDWVMRNVDADGAALRRREFVTELRGAPVWIYSPTQAIALAVEVAVPVASFVVKLHV